MVISGRLQLRRALLTFALDKNKDCVSMSNVSPPSLHHECAGKGWELVFCTRSDMQLTQQQHLHKKVFGKIATLRIKFHKCETLRIKLHKYACFLIWKLCKVRKRNATFWAISGENRWLTSTQTSDWICIGSFMINYLLTWLKGERPFNTSLYERIRSTLLAKIFIPHSGIDHNLFSTIRGGDIGSDYNCVLNM